MIDNRKLKILAIVPTGFCFGLQHITVSFFSHFSQSVKSHFLLTRWTTGDMEKLLKQNHIPYSFSWLGMFSRKIDWLNIKMSLHTLFKIPRLYYDFFKLIRSIQPDILFFANHHELILLSPVLRFTKRKVVVHMHDPSPAIPFQIKSFKRYDRVVDKYIAISEDVRNRTIALGCAPEKINVVSNGISIPSAVIIERSSLFCNNAKWPENSFIIGITGQMTEKKGALDLLKAFKSVYKSNPAVRLVIGGKKEEPFYSLLENKISDWGLKGLVYFPGWLENKDDFFRNIDVFVLASKHDEGYGLVVAEAMVNNKPVVITRSGGATEIVEDEINGFLVSKERPDEMAGKLLVLSNDQSLCRKMGQNGRSRIIERFSINEQALKMEMLLFDIAK